MYTNLPYKNVMLWVNIHVNNVNDVDFDANINRDMCMKVNVMCIFIDIKLCIVCEYIYLYHAYYLCA